MSPSIPGWLSRLRPRRGEWRRDALAGLPNAISSVPDGMASSLLAGVPPVHGLYASTLGPMAGGLTTSTRMMVITTTSAAALAAGSALSSVPADEQAEAILWLTLLTGVLILAAAAARLGRYVRFVSQSVMLGFLTGIAVNIVLGQLPDLLGAEPSGGIALGKALSIVFHPGRVDGWSTIAGLSALVLLFALASTRLSMLSSLLALAVPTLTLLLINQEVARVQDSGAIPAGVPVPHLPELSAFSPQVLAGAVSVAAIILIQGAGVAEAAPNRDGSRSRTNQDFAAQGAGNLASGFFTGMPVGGSVGSTALNVAAGAVSRWGAIWSGIWMLVILVAFSHIVGEVLMPTLSAVLIYAAVMSLKPHEIWTIGHAGPTPLVAMTSTFAATLFLPVAAAVGVGVTLSLILQLNQESIDLRIVELAPTDDGGALERPAPATLAAGQVVVLDVYGSLFYAGARTLQLHLPDPAGARGAAVILRLRGRTTLGATFFTVIAGYARTLHAEGGTLFLSGVDPSVLRLWERDALTYRFAGIQLYPAQPELGASTHAAYLDAQSRRVAPA